MIVMIGKMSNYFVRDLRRDIATLGESPSEQEDDPPNLRI